MRIGVRHVYWLMEGTLGGRPGPMKEAWSPAEMASGGVGGIVSLAEPVESLELQEAGIRHLPLFQPMILLETRSEHLQFLSELPAAFRFLDEIRAQGKAALVHCYHGRDRTGAALACYLAAREDLGPAEAVERVRAANPGAMAALGYEPAVHTFDALYRRNRSLFEASP